MIGHSDFQSHLFRSFSERGAADPSLCFSVWKRSSNCRHLKHTSLPQVHEDRGRRSRWSDACCSEISTSQYIIYNIERDVRQLASSTCSQTFFPRAMVFFFLWSRTILLLTYRPQSGDRPDHLWLVPCTVVSKNVQRHLPKSHGFFLLFLSSTDWSESYRLSDTSCSRERTRSPILVINH